MKISPEEARWFYLGWATACASVVQQFLIIAPSLPDPAALAALDTTLRQIRETALSHHVLNQLPGTSDQLEAALTDVFDTATAAIHHAEALRAGRTTGDIGPLIDAMTAAMERFADAAGVGGELPPG